MRVLVFGDSITQGYWAIEHGWVDLLRMHFDKKQASDLEGRDEPTIFNLGVSADTPEDILKRIRSEVSARTRPHHSQKPVVIVQIGVNDSSLNPDRNRVGIDTYRKNLRKIVAEVEDAASKVVFIGSSACYEKKTTPVFWDTNSYTNKDIEKYENAMSEVAKDLGVTFIPVFKEFLDAIEDDKDLLPDGLHPNDKGHKKIYEIVSPVLERELS